MAIGCYSVCSAIWVHEAQRGIRLDLPEITSINEYLDAVTFGRIERYLDVKSARPSTTRFQRRLSTMAFRCLVSSFPSLLLSAHSNEAMMLVSAFCLIVGTCWGSDFISRPA